MNFKGISRVTRTFRLEFGPLRAQGVPAVLVALSGLAFTVGAVRVLNQNAAALPETLREAKRLVDAIRAERPSRSLNS